MAELLGHGIYSVPEAARLSGVAPAKIRRWVFGHSTKTRAGERVQYDGLWTSEFHDEDEQALSFHDLLEVRFVDAFRRHGVSLQTIRLAASHAREFLDTDYPFTCQRFRTDGRGIFASVAPEVDDSEERERLLDLARRQYVFKDVVSPSLYAGIEYDQKDSAIRWFPMRRTHQVVLDPKRSFGKPILTEYSVPTETLAAAVRVEDDVRRVARLYEIPTEQVRTAVRFEERIADRAGTA